MHSTVPVGVDKWLQLPIFIIDAVGEVALHQFLFLIKKN